MLARAWREFGEYVLVGLVGLLLRRLGPIIRSVIGLFSGKLYEVIRLAVDIKAIHFVNADHLHAFEKASVTLAIIARDKGPESDEFKRVKADAKNALSKFVRFHGA